MRIWDRVRAARLGRSQSFASVDSNDQSTSSSRSVRLGGIYPQPPAYRRICCNDRDANLMAGFKVFLIFLGMIYFLQILIWASFFLFFCMFVIWAFWILVSRCIWILFDLFMGTNVLGESWSYLLWWALGLEEESGIGLEIGFFFFF